MVDWITQVRRPVSNVNALWTVNTYENIDEVILDPAAGDGSTVHAEDGDDGEEQIWHIEDPDDPFMWSIDRVVIKAYGWIDEEPGYPEVRIKVGAGWSSQQALSLPDVTSPGWVTLTFNGTWDKADFEADFQVGVEAGHHQLDDETHIDTLYAIVHGYPWSS